MSISERDLLHKLEFEYKQLFAATEVLTKSIETLQKQRQEIAQKIQDLTDLADPTQQEKLDGLRKEQVALNQELVNKLTESKELNEKMKLFGLQLAFQKDILELWGKEKYYSDLLNESGMSSSEALLQEQGYVVPPENNEEWLGSTFACDYERMGRKDIADLLLALQDPLKHSWIFETAKTQYTKNPDYNYGFILSLCYEYGYGTPIDKKAAFEIEQYFAKLNHPLALCLVANEYFNGDIVEVDQKKAVEYYQRATAPDQKSFYFPHFLWGQRLLDGDEVETDEIQGLKFLKIADENGITMATVTLATYCSTKLAALEEAHANASATTSGGTEETASGPTQADIKQAKEQVYFYARKADESQCILGKFMLARCYDNGWGVTVDRQRYFDIVNQCAASGLAGAIEVLALLYQNGYEGVQMPNAIQSLKLHFDCLRRNKMTSLEKFKNLLSENQNSVEFMSIAFDLCKKCLQGHLLENPLDSTVIGLFYKEGIFVGRNMQRAIPCLRKAAALGLGEAATALALLAGSKENQGFISMSEVRKYFIDANDEDIVSVRQHYRSNFMPLFKSLKETWPMIGCGMPDVITQLIADYADTVLDEQEQEKEKASTAAVASPQ